MPRLDQARIGLVRALADWTIWQPNRRHDSCARLYSAKPACDGKHCDTWRPQRRPPAPSPHQIATGQAISARPARPPIVPSVAETAVLGMVQTGLLEVWVVL